MTHDVMNIIDDINLILLHQAIDAVFFSGAGGMGKDGHWGVVTAMERRPNALTSVLIYLKVLKKYCRTPECTRGLSFP